MYDFDGWIVNFRGLENDFNKSEDDFEIVMFIVFKGY